MHEPIAIPNASAEPDAYVQALLDTLGERDPIAVMHATSDRVSALCAALNDETWNVSPSPGEWSPKQIVGHLLDVDIVYGFRWRLALTADRPTYPGYDERAFAELPAAAPVDLLAAFVGLRAASLAMLARLSTEQLQRRAVHAEQGDEDVDRMIRKVAGHDLAHLDQLQRAIGAAVANRVTGSTEPSSIEARLADFFDAWNRHDVDAIVTFFTPDGAYLASIGPEDDGTAFRGIDEVRRGVAAFLATYPDARYTDSRVVAVGNQAIARWTFHGTTVAGAAIRYRGVDVFELEGDLIRVKDAFRKERAAPIGR